MNQTLKSIALTFLAALCTFMALISNASDAADLETLQNQWAVATYNASGDQRVAQLEALTEQARQATAAHPEDASLKIWHGIIASSLAGEKGGLGALSLAKEAREALESSLALDASALAGSAHTSLGTLYHQVPGWPIGFGSDKKARAHLEQALAINPDGIDPNYFMAQFLIDEGDLSQAKSHLQTALKAPDRPGRALADEGRREEIRQLLATLETKIARK